MSAVVITLAETSSATVSKFRKACAGSDLIAVRGVATGLEAGKSVAAAAAVCGCLALWCVGVRNRLVLKSITSTSKPSLPTLGVISNLSIVPVRIPEGRRRRKRNSLQSPWEDFGFRISDFGLFD